MVLSRYISATSRIVVVSVLLSVPWRVNSIELRDDGYHVRPGENIQTAIELASSNPTNKVVKVHAGEYRPSAKRQAMIYFNRAHDGVKLEAVGSVTLTAANPELTRPNIRSYPAVVNHVVYFGDGISSNTVLRGFRITGANAYVTDKFTDQMEPNKSIPKNTFFLTDGGAIKIFGRSYPVIQQVEIVNNYTTPCGAGVSIQHEGHNTNWVTIEDSIFRNNRTQVTGAALDLLTGSAAKVINCLFVGNISNTGIDVVAVRANEKPFTNSGALTVFQNSKVIVQNCTFTGNRNAVDDLGGISEYINSIFYRNDLNGGYTSQPRYELDLQKGGVVKGCFISGDILDPLNAVSDEENTLNSPNPDFNHAFVPRASGFEKVGYRPRK